MLSCPDSFQARGIARSVIDIQWRRFCAGGCPIDSLASELAEHDEEARVALATLTVLQGGLLMAQIRRDAIALEAVLDAMIDRIRCHAPG